MNLILEQERIDLRDMQKFHVWLDELKQFDQEPMTNLAYLAGEVGEVINAVRYLRRSDEAGLEAAREHIAEELADCLAFISKLANCFEIDLQDAYVKKMTHNIGRTWDKDNR
ncbi:MAG: MazG nucleotide pyrophosphohydrolase domain-containing protein [Candidatus Promineifilaceae bacterium]